VDTFFPTKRVTAGAVMRDSLGRLLIVKPSYRAGWLLPGGICEHDESPATTLDREVREELGINVRITGLLFVDYLCAHDVYDESVHFLFACDSLSQAEIDLIQLPPSELLDFQFCSDELANDLLVPTLARRLRQLAKGYPKYLENGVAPPHMSAQS
jgi:ADP-ribose pyrophosphatase YjhB (NUDIX family)